MVEEINNEGGLSRRTVVKGAAWSLPVLAVAVAAPAATASVAFDVQVTGNCQNDYDLSVLQGLGLGILLPAVQTALGALGLTPGASRSFTISADEGTIPAGTSFTLSDPGAILDLVALEGIIEANVLFVATVNAGGLTITTTAPITSANPQTIEYIDAVIDLGVASTVTLSLAGSDNPGGADAPDSGSVSNLAAAAVDLSTLGVIGASGTLAIQTCDL